MVSSQIISIAAGAAVAIIFIYFLSRRKSSDRLKVQAPSMVGSLAAFFDGDDKKALKEMKALALADKGTPEIYLSIGFLYRKMGDCTKAAQIHEILLGNNEIDDDYKALIVTELARDYFYADMPLKTLAVLGRHQGAEKNPDNLLLLARASLAVHDFDGAAAFYSRYEKLSGCSLKGFYCKCMLEKARAAKDAGKAAKAIKQALEANRDCRPARFITAAMLRKEGKHTKAMDEYKTIIKNGLIRDMDDMKSIEAAFIESGEETALLSFLKANMADGAKSPFTAVYAAGYYEGLGDKDEAKSILYSYLTRTGFSAAAARAYASLTGDKVLSEALKNERPFSCSICGTGYEKYQDDCRVCGSFDSIEVK